MSAHAAPPRSRRGPGAFLPCLAPVHPPRRAAHPHVHRLPRPRPRCAHRPSRPHLPTMQGWADARHHLLPSLPGATRAEGLPGVHFPSPPHISADDLLAILRGDAPDAWVNDILRTLLGWRKLDPGPAWDDQYVQPMWRDAYKNGPPDFIGKVGQYEPQFDRPVKIAVQNLSRSIPPEYKQLLIPTMKPFGFSGLKIKDLTPNLTRRAQAVNWIIYWYKTHYPDYTWS